MIPARRCFFFTLSFSLLIGLLCTCEAGRAQAQNPARPSVSGATANAQTSAGPKKPTRKTDQQLTSDSVALLAVHRAPVGTTPTTQAATADDPSTPMDDTGRTAAEISSLETQIKDKQKRIVLLMRLFVDDERSFVSDPSNTKVDSVVQDRRKYEQDELLWETAELARLKARLNELTAPKQVSTQ